MSNDVDNKVVTMTFDNAKFASKMEETIRGLEKLNQSLKMVEGVKGMADAQKQVNSFKMDGVKKTVADAQGAMGKFNAAPVVNAVADAQSAVSKFDASNMGDQADGISAKWVAMAAGIFAVVSGLVTKIGGKLAEIGNSFTLGPLKEGFSEYQTNIGAIQTILANTDRFGTKLPEVTANLDELNEYSDKTIYNFGEMVKNIGLFTNAGIRVGDATSMIKGFSNAAAASGTTAEGAAGAAYQLSQALSTGTIRLMDWRSLSNVGMGNKNMQQGIIELAESMGTLDKAGLSAEEVTSNFTGTLEKGWLSADVMSNYLKIMAGDMDDAQLATLGLDKTQIEWFKRQQKIAEESATKVRTFTQLVSTIKESIGSGWSETFRTVIGDFEGATQVFTGINNAIGGIVGKSATARNDLLKGWAAFGGRNAAIEGVVRIWAALLAVVQPIGKAFRSVFPKQTVTGLLEFTDKFRNFTKTLMPAKETTMAISRIFKGLFSILKIGVSVIWQVGKLILSVFGNSLSHTVRGGLAPFLATIGDVITSFSTWLSEGGRLKNFFESLQNAIITVLGPFKGLAAIFMAIAKLAGVVFGGAMRIVIDVFRELFGATAGKTKGAGKGIEDFFNKISRGTIYAVYYITLFTEKVDSMMNMIHDAIAGVRDIPGAFKQIKNILTDGDFTGGPFAEDSPIVDSIFKFRDKLKEVKGVVEEFMYSLTSGFTQDEGTPVELLALRLRDAVMGIGETLKNVKDSIMGGASGFSEAGAAIFDGIKKSITEADWMGMFLDTGHKLYESFMSAIDAHSPSRMFADAALAIPQGIAEGIKNGWQAIKDAVSSIGDKLRELFGGIGDAIASENFERLIKAIGITGLVKMGSDVTSLFRNIGGAIGAFKRTMKSVTSAMDQAEGTLKTYQKSIRWNILRKIAISIALLAASMIALSFIDPAKLAQGAAAVGAALLGIVAAMRSMDKMGTGAKKLLAMSYMIRQLSVSILILALAVKILGDMNDRGDLVQGLAGVYALMGGLAGAIALMDGQKLKMVGVSATLLGLAAAILLLTFAVKTLGRMNDKGDLAQGLVAVGVLLGGLGGAIRLMGSSVELSGVALALLGIGLAMLMLARAVKSMGELEGDNIKRGLIGLAGGLAIILGALAAMKKLELEKASLGLLLMAFALRGIADVVQIFGDMKGGDLAKGLLGLGVALALVSAAIYAVGQQAIGAVGILIAAYAMTVLADAIKEFAELKFGDVAKGIGLMVGSLLALGITMAVLGVLSPLILAFGLALAIVGIGVLAFGAGAWLLANGIKHLTEAGRDGIDAFMYAMDTFVGAMPRWLGILGDAIIEGIKHILSGTPELIDLLGVILGKLLDVANENLPKVFEILGTVLQGCIQLIKDSTQGWVEAGIGLLQALLDGLGENAESLAESAVNLLLSFMDALSTAIDEHAEELGEKGRKLAKSILDGIINALVPTSVQEAIGNLVSGMVDWFKSLLGIQSPSTVFAGFGGDILQGLVNGLGGMLGTVLNFFISLPMWILGAIGNLLSLLWQTGADLLSGLWNGAKAIWNSVSSWVGQTGSRVLSAIGNLLETLRNKGRDLITGLKNGITGAWTTVSTYVVTLPNKIVGLFGNALSTLASTGRNIVEGLKSGISEKWSAFVEWFKDKIGGIPIIGDQILKILSPSRRFMYTGNMIVAGLRKGMADTFPKAYRDVKSSTRLLMDTMNAGLSELTDINPTITPVVDLSNVKMGVDAIDSMMDGTSIDAGVSLDNAKLISAETSAPKEQAVQSTKSEGGVTFIQNNNSPRALSEADIYRNTNGQVARAAKELGIAS